MPMTHTYRWKGLQMENRIKNINENWNSTSYMPDDTMLVLVRLDDGDLPICFATYEEGQWRYSPLGGVIDKYVMGWLDLHDAAAVLDNQPQGGEED